jgi:hypothetical protein
MHISGYFFIIKNEQNRTQIKDKNKIRQSKIY